MSTVSYDSLKMRNMMSSYKVGCVERCSNIICFYAHNGFSHLLLHSVVDTVLCKSNESEFRRNSCFVLLEISLKFRSKLRTFDTRNFVRMFEISKRSSKNRSEFSKERNINENSR